LYRVRTSIDSCAGVNTRGKSAEAFTFIQAKRPIIDLAYAARRNDASAQTEFASFLIEIGMLGACRGEFDMGYANVKEAFDLLTALQASQPKENSYLRELAMVEIELGTIEWHRANYDEAARIALSARDKISRVITQNPDDIGVHMNAMVINAKLINFLLLAQRNAEVGAPLEDAEASATTILKLAPDNQFAKIFQSAIAVNKSKFDARMGRVDRAIAEQRRLLEKARAALQPDNYRSYLQTAKIALALSESFPPSRRAEACQALFEAVDLLQQMVANDAENVSTSLELSRAGGQLNEWIKAGPCLPPTEAQKAKRLIDSAHTAAQKIVTRKIAVRDLAEIAARLDIAAN
jgi:tetratricopeptide (TPR) repeat protein